MQKKPEVFLQEKAAEAVKVLYGADLAPESLQVQVTRKEFEGDYTLVTFPLSRLSHAAPEQTGNAVGSWLLAHVPEISACGAVKGFLNISFSGYYWNRVFADIAADGNFGRLPSTGKTIMVEFSSPNTNKPLHLGHIRNNLLGDSVSRLLQANGHKVIRVTLVNDRGVHICKSMLAWQKRGNGATPESSGRKGDHLVGDCYVAFNDIFREEVRTLVAGGMPEEQAEKEAPCLKEAQRMLLKWEQGDREVRDLWQRMNGWVLAGFEQTYKELGITFDKVYYESQTYILGKELVAEGLRKGIFVREDDGSVWCDLTADGLDRKLLLRSDGTSVYMTQDLGTAERRFTENRLDEHIYVVGNEQDYHFQVLKLILKKLGFAWSDHIHHLSYGMVELPDGKMKSREGTVVDADELLAKMYREAERKTTDTGKLADMTPEEKKKLFRMIGLGALKYFIIKVDPKKTMLFNPEESIDFNGNTGPFIQYTHARIRSILRKAAAQGLSYGPAEAFPPPAASSDPAATAPAAAASSPAVTDSASSPATAPASPVTDSAPAAAPSAKEVRLIKFLAAYPEKVAEAGESLSPSVIANYAYDLAKEFNQYYHETPVLRESDPAVLRFRLLLSDTLARILADAMGLLGIALPERM